MGIWSQPKKRKKQKGQRLSYLQRMNKISHNLFSSHHTTNPVCALSTAVDSHLVIFNTRHIQPEGTNYSSVFNMLQCLQRTVLEKYSYFAWQEKPLKTKERALSDESQVHPKSNKRKQFGKLDMLWWKIVKTRVYFLSGTVHQIIFLCNPKAWLSLKKTQTVWNWQVSVSQLSCWEPGAEQRGQGRPSLPSPPFHPSAFKITALQDRLSCESAGKWDLKCYWNENTNERWKTCVSINKTEWARCLIPFCSCANHVCTKS